MSQRPLLVALFLTGTFAASACTAILVPDTDDDGVVRCNNTEDCEQPTDNRYRSQCVRADEQDANSDKVCAPFYTDISCNGAGYSGDHPFFLAYEDATDSMSKSTYGACLEENFGKRGCPSNAGACNDGLEVREDNICDDPNDPIPAAYPPDVGSVDIAGQDVLDSFCATYFCDDTFVCDTSSFNCVQCDTNDPESFGEGGCGRLYIQGELSPAYVPLDEANCNGDQNPEQLTYGDAPEPDGG